MLINILDISDYFTGKRIALVGNASSVFNSEHNIDSYDLVFRLNKGLPHEARPALGKRTDILGLSLSLSEAELDAFGNLKYIIWFTPKREAISETLQPKLNYFYEVSDWEDLHKHLGHRPSTGCMAINFLVKYTKFKSLTLIGFDFWETPNWYHGSGPCHHSPSSEKSYVQDLQNKYPIFIER